MTTIETIENKTDRETMALVSLLVLTIEQQDALVRLIERNTRQSDAQFSVDRKFLNNVKMTQRYAKTFDDWAERTLMSVLKPEEITAFDGIRRQAHDLMVLNMMAYEYLTDPSKVNTILKRIQRYKTRRKALRDNTIKQMIMLE